MKTERVCRSCGRALAPHAPEGLCPQCLLKVGIGSEVDIGPETGEGRAGFVPPQVEELAAKFPQLELLELIGKGGMGAVYKARQRELDRVVALKILPPDIGRDPAFAERFTREAKALAKLNHPGIVTIYDFGRTDGLYFFLMEYVDGVNLRQLLPGKRVSAREALAIVPEICDALQYAHDQGIVHRDIKPENIMLDRRGRVKVADFGLAKIVGASLPRPSGRLSPSGGEERAGRESSSLTDASKVLGTPQYMSPEQITAPGEVDHRADIYALGVVFYQMLTGELPGKRIEPPSKKVCIDVRLDEVVLRALEQRPELRYQQASILKTQIETISADTGSAKAAAASFEAPASESAGKGEKSAKRQPATARRMGRRWLIAVGMVFGLALATLCIRSVREWNRQPPTVGSAQAEMEDPAPAGLKPTELMPIPAEAAILWAEAKASTEERLKMLQPNDTSTRNALVNELFAKTEQVKTLLSGTVAEPFVQKHDAATTALRKAKETNDRQGELAAIDEVQAVGKVIEKMLAAALPGEWQKKRSLDIQVLAQKYIPGCRIHTNVAENTQALITRGGEVLKLDTAASEQPTAIDGVVGYWFSQTMDFLSRQKPKVFTAEEAAGLVQLMHWLSRGPAFMRQKVYSARRFDRYWVVQVEHDYANFPASARAILPYELQVDEADNVVQFRQRCYAYPGSAEVFTNTVNSVYKSEIKRNNGRDYSEVLAKELQSAWEKEKDQKPAKMR